MFGVKEREVAGPTHEERLENLRSQIADCDAKRKNLNERILREGTITHAFFNERRELDADWERLLHEYTQLKGTDQGLRKMDGNFASEPQEVPAGPKYTPAFK